MAQLKAEMQEISDIYSDGTIVTRRRRIVLYVDDTELDRLLAERLEKMGVRQMRIGPREYKSDALDNR